MKLATCQRVFRSFKSWNKCICIGANKTGTSSLQAIMESVLGYRANQSEVEKYAVIQAIKGNYWELKEIMRQYDFHKDIPASQGDYYAIFDVLFPNSKFILTKRDTASWSKSFLNFYLDYMIDEALGTTTSQSLFNGYGNIWIRHFWGKEVSYIKQSMNRWETRYEGREKMKERLLENQELNEMISMKYEDRNERICGYFKERKKDLMIIETGKIETINPLIKFLELPEILECKWPVIKPEAKSKGKIGYDLDITFNAMNIENLNKLAG